MSLPKTQAFFLFDYLCGKATVTSVNITLFWKNDCLCHQAAVAFSPFWKLRVWMWCRTCIVQYVRDAQCFTPLSGFWNKKCVTIQCWKLNVTFFTHIQKVSFNHFVPALLQNRVTPWKVVQFWSYSCYDCELGHSFISPGLWKVQLMNVICSQYCPLFNPAL